MSDGSSESGSSTWSDVKRVLAIRLDSMGDVLMTSPALRAIREAPGVELLALLTSPAGAAAAALIAEVDKVMIYAAPWMKASGTPALAQDEAIIAQLRSERFDAAVIFTVFSQTPFPAAMLCRLAGIPRVLMHARERAYALASDEVRETEPENGIRHEVRRHLDLVSRRGWAPAHDQLSVTVPETAHRRIAEFKLPKGRWAVVHPGASAPSRRWPPDHFVEALRQLTALGWSFVLCLRYHPSGAIDALLTDGTIGLYLGWVSIATAANAAAVLTAAGFDGFGLSPDAWAVFVLAVASAVGVMLAIVGKGRIAPAISLSWGLAWVAVGRLTGELISTPTGIAAIASVVVIVAVTAIIRLTSGAVTAA